MIIQLSLIAAMILQILAAIISIRLTRVTKYNLSWMLICAGFILVALRRFLELIPLISDAEINRQLFIWMGVTASVFFASGLFLIQKIFKYMKKVEDEKREMEKILLHATIRAEENQRKRFAKDLHDELGPILSTVKMSLTTVARRENDSTSSMILRNAESAIDEAIKSIREIANNLSPHILENFGLIKAIRQFIYNINLTNALMIDFSTNLNDKRFKNDAEVVIYRVICELITNTIKHAEASNAEINLIESEDQIHCSYTDDGVGFDLTDTKKLHLTGMGFSNIQSRIFSLNGSFHYSSENGKGIRAAFSIPVKPQYEKDAATLDI
jgi:signal transduction histidine kinase